MFRLSGLCQSVELTGIYFAINLVQGSGMHTGRVCDAGGVQGVKAEGV
jgi:hypothetical protein